MEAMSESGFESRGVKASATSSPETGITASPSKFPEGYLGVTCPAQGIRCPALNTLDGLPVESYERAYLRS
jgi:hypothetical protein